MYHIKLVKGSSYTGIVKATKASPDVYVPDEDIADKAVASGYFILVEETEGDEDGNTNAEEKVGDEKLAAMTKANLIEYANEKGISLDGCDTKAQILEAISSALGGSLTMMELQE